MTILIRLYYIFIYFVLFAFVFACNERVTNSDNSDDPDDKFLVNKVGSESTFEIASWNIENFPLAGTTTIDDLKIIISNLDIDLIAVQEIASISSFDTLISQLPAWKGVLSGDTYSSGNYQKTGIIYKSQLISISDVKNIFPDEWYAFPRPPLAAFVEIKDGKGLKFDFNIIVLHLKAYGGEENKARRDSACVLLKNYIDLEIAAGADSDFVVLGDWNDELTDVQEDNVFLPFLNDSLNYMFLTKSITDQYSYIDERYKSLIDHILITEDAFNEYGNGKTEVLYLDNQFSPYPSRVSDHRPVVSIFEGIIIE